MDLYTLLRDLGLGKETQFSYPWNPSNSPSMCEKALEFLDGDLWIDTIDKDGKIMKDYNGKIIKNPGEACNEFVFTRA